MMMMMIMIITILIITTIKKKKEKNMIKKQDKKNKEQRQKNRGEDKAGPGVASFTTYTLYACEAEMLPSVCHPPSPPPFFPQNAKM